MRVRKLQRKVFVSVVLSGRVRYHLLTYSIALLYLLTLNTRGRNHGRWSQR